MTQAQLESAHRHCDNHRAELLASDLCGCFYCLKIFNPSEIDDWVDEKTDEAEGETALCPHCGIDSVLGSASGLTPTETFLREMHFYWFQR